MLTEIVEKTTAGLPSLRLRESEFSEQALQRHSTARFVDALSGDGLGVIAEIKRRSPSRGTIDDELDPIARATAYQSGGAVAISVLTEEHYFSGSPDDLSGVKAAVDIPVLRKDFIVDSIQIVQAKAIGADAILLIMACLSDREATELLAEAARWHLDALVEAHTDDEAKRAADCGAVIIGVNNRDLSTFDVDLGTAERIAGFLPDEVVKVAESGIWTSADSHRMRSAGFDAVLVGEALVRADDPAGLIGKLRS